MMISLVQCFVLDGPFRTDAPSRGYKRAVLSAGSRVPQV